MVCVTTCVLRGFQQGRMPRERACVSAHSRPLSKSAGATGIVFQPFEEVQPELAVVAKKHGATDSFARSSYHDDSEAAVNEQINVEYTISYAYHSMYSYFDRDNVGLPGFAKYFKEASDDERDHAESFIEYQNQRGGRVKLQGIVMPEMEFLNEEKGDALYAMELALSLEKLNFMKLQGLRAIADKHQDAALSDFTDNFIAEQVEDIKRAAVYVSQLRRVGKGHGVWHFDQELEYGNGTA